MRKEKQPVPIKAPESLHFKTWVVVGLDLSLSRTGYSIGKVTLNSEGVEEFTPICVGSLKPEISSSPVWLRCKLIAEALVEEIICPVVKALLDEGAALLLCFEAFTPKNDFLSSINRVVHTTFLSEGSLISQVPTYILSVNASTLRSLMGLTKTGVQNKKENIDKAYTFISKEHFPSLDTDSCDAVLLNVVATYAATSLLGRFDSVPIRFRTALGSMAQEVKGKGQRARIITKGLFYRPEYWYTHTKATYSILKKDAASNSNKLFRKISTV